jgi:hypothetical protein
MLQERCAPKLRANRVHARTHLRFAIVPSRQAKLFSSQKGSSDRPRPELEQTRLRNPQGSLPDQAIRLAQRGDAAAFEYIYRLHSRRVYSLCLRLARDLAEAEDLTQEAFLQLFRKIHIPPRIGFFFVAPPANGQRSFYELSQEGAADGLAGGSGRNR